MTNSIGEIRDADFLFVIGSNTSEAHPIIAMEMKRAIKAGATMVVADPRAIWMTSIADKHLQLRPGTDVWLLNALANVIVTEGLVDQQFIDENTENWDAVREAVLPYTPEEAEKITGVPAEDIRWTARKYATTDKAGIYYTLGITQHSHGTDNVYALANLVLMTGHLGKPSSGMNPLRGQNNVQGANDSGATPVYYPGYQRVDDPEVHAKYEASWGVKLSPEPGMNLNVMMKTVGDGIKALFIMGEDIIISEPNVRKLEKGMNDLDFVVIQEPFFNETTRFADVVLPAAVFAEKDGVFTNSERRVQRVRKGVEPPGQARADWEILTALANACGADWHYSGPAEIYDELARDADKFAGISHARVDTEIHEGMTGIQWPCPDPEHPGTKYLHSEGVLRGKGLFMPVGLRSAPVHRPHAVPLQRRHPDAPRAGAAHEAVRSVRRDPSTRCPQAGNRAWRHRPRGDPPRRGGGARDRVAAGAPRLHLDAAALRRGPRQRAHQRCWRCRHRHGRVQGLRRRDHQDRGPRGHRERRTLPGQLLPDPGPRLQRGRVWLGRRSRGD